MNVRLANSKILFLISFFFFILQPVDGGALQIDIDDEFTLSPTTLVHFDVSVHNVPSQTMSSDLTADDDVQCTPTSSGDSVQSPCFFLISSSYTEYGGIFVKTVRSLALQDVLWQQTTTTL